MIKIKSDLESGAAWWGHSSSCVRRSGSVGLKKTEGELQASFLESWERGHSSESNSNLSNIYRLQVCTRPKGSKILVKTTEDGREKLQDNVERFSDL